MRLPDALTIPNAENSFCGTHAAQTWNDLALWEEFFNRYPLASLIELGTWKGGMAAFLALQCKARGIAFTTIDSNGAWQENRELVESLGGQCLVMDVFDANTMTKLMEEQPRPCLLFCDNGDKRRELREIASQLEADQYIAVHDWGSESGPEDIPDDWQYLLHDECERMHSLTRYFKIYI